MFVRCIWLRKVFCQVYLYVTCPEFYGIPDIWFLIPWKINTLCIATSFDIRHPIFTPAMLIVSNQIPIMISGKSSLSSTYEDYNINKINENSSECNIDMQVMASLLYLIIQKRTRHRHFCPCCTQNEGREYCVWAWGSALH